MADSQNIIPSFYTKEQNLEKWSLQFDGKQIAFSRLLKKPFTISIFIDGSLKNESDAQQIEFSFIGDTGSHSVEIKNDTKENNFPLVPYFITGLSIKIDNSPVEGTISDARKLIKQANLGLWIFVFFLGLKTIVPVFRQKDLNDLIGNAIVYGLPFLLLVWFGLTANQRPRRAIYGALIIGILETIDFASGFLINFQQNLVVSLIIWGGVRWGALTALWKGRSKLKELPSIPKKTQFLKKSILVFGILVLISVSTFFLIKFYQTHHELSGADIFERNSSAVVTIMVLDENNKVIGFGSGVFISEDGKILTNYHVVDAGLKLQVQLMDKSAHSVTGVIAADKNVDFAIVKIDAVNTPFIEIGDSLKIKTGDKIFTISSPESLAFANSFGSGEISGVRQRESLADNKGIGTVFGKQLFQFTAPVSPGSSGGALFNEKGKLVGLIMAQSREGQNINLAIPIDELKPSLNSKSFLDFAAYKKISSTESVALESPSGGQNSTNGAMPENQIAFKDLLKFGNNSFEAGNYDKAIRFWAEAFKQKPKNIIVINKIAYALAKLHLKDKALVFYEEALKINPKHWLTYFNLGELAQETYLAGCEACKDEAKGLYLKSLELNPPPHVKEQAEQRLIELFGQ